MDFKYDPILGVLRKADKASSGETGGIDTSDATAGAGDILNGKTAYGADGKLTGTIPTVTASMSDNVVTVPKGYVKSAQTLTVGTALNAYTITPAANAQVISKGSYLKGEVTVAGDTNLTAANIKSGVTIFNVAGTYEGESTGGTSAECYKCASVDTSAKTWSGYKAVFDSGTGTWSFESGVTEGLTYTSVTPIVGGIYSADALITVASVYMGYYPTSAPVNPASASDGDWNISASSNLDSKRNCIYAFHETIGHDNYCWHSSSGMPQWIQWQNTAQKVLVKSYILTQRDSAGSYSSTWTLSGSNNGETWDELDSVSLDSVAASQVTTRNLTSNNTPYYYHRITVTKCDITGTNYATIGRIQAFNYLQE